MPINVDPVALADASSATTAAITQGEATSQSLTSAKANFDGAIDALRAAVNTAFSGWSAGQGFAAFEAAQNNLKTAMQAFDENIMAAQTSSQNVNRVLVEFKTALANSGGSMAETDNQIASAWGSVG